MVSYGIKLRRFVEAIPIQVRWGQNNNIMKDTDINMVFRERMKINTLYSEYDYTVEEVVYDQL